PTLFEQGGTAAAAQTGEEYRQRLRAALESDRERIIGLPGRAGSGMRKGKRTGILFCAEVTLAEERRTFLRFVPARANWRQPDAMSIERETGTCLRLIDCTEDTPRHVPTALNDGVFAFWDAALADIISEWDNLSDPANLQPQVRRLNRQVAEFIRAHPPHDVEADKLAKALDILEAPWPMREEALLREQFRDRAGPGAARSRRLVEWILATGLERFEPPAPLPPISEADVRLVCWMVVEAEA
ncbi:MAG: helicase, partial [bacterium]